MRRTMIGQSASMLIAGVVLFAGLLGPVGSARADEYIDKANAPFRTIAPAQRTEQSLFPALAKLTPPPSAVSRLAIARLLPPTAGAFKEVADWSTSAESKAALDALKKCTDELDYRKAFAIALPYGADKTDPDLVAIGMFVDLNDPPSLAMADFKYIAAMDRLAILVQVEATRLVSAGETGKAIELLCRTIHLSRQMMDRGFFTEQRWGYESVALCAERIRDVIYTDMKSDKPSMKPEEARDAIRRLRDKDGIIGLERLSLPLADRLAGEQLLFRIMGPDGKPDPQQFSKALTQLSDRRRPLRMFSESAKWEAIRSVHADAAETRKRLLDVFGDWQNRFGMRPSDPLLKTPSDFMKTSRAQFGSVDRLIGDLDAIFDLRANADLQIRGTRAALAAYAFTRKNGSFPPSITSPQPEFIRPNDNVRDPFVLDREFITYVVPGRAGATATWDIQVFVGSEPAFAFPVDKETFVLYVVGPDVNNNGMRRATQYIRDDKGDFLLFPPLTSTIRKNMLDNGELK